MHYAYVACEGLGLGLGQTRVGGGYGPILYERLLSPYDSEHEPDEDATLAGESPSSRNLNARNFQSRTRLIMNKYAAGCRFANDGSGMIVQLLTIATCCENTNTEKSEITILAARESPG